MVRTNHKIKKVAANFQPFTVLTIWAEQNNFQSDSVQLVMPVHKKHGAMQIKTPHIRKGKGSSGIQYDPLIF